MLVVSDTPPIVALTHLGLLSILGELYREVLVPPVVVRLEGTNVEKARKMLDEAAIEGLHPAVDLTDAAKRVCVCV